MYIVEPTTSGAASWPLLIPVEKVKATFIAPTLSDLISSRPENGPGFVAVSDLRPGPAGPPPPPDPRAAEYEGNATHIANGQRYFQWFNCNGCHFSGGGGIGPALMDDKWRYGGMTEQIVASIE